MGNFRPALSGEFHTGADTTGAGSLVLLHGVLHSQTSRGSARSPELAREGPHRHGESACLSTPGRAGNKAPKLLIMESYRQHRPIPRDGKPGAATFAILARVLGMIVSGPPGMPRTIM